MKFYQRYSRQSKPLWKYLSFSIGGVCSVYLLAMVGDIKKSTGDFYRTKAYHGHKDIILPIIASNVGIFFAWKIPRFQSKLRQYFMHRINSNPITLITCTFSHSSSMHLAFNMIALYSFGSILQEKMGYYQFLAFYLSCGILSSTGSHLYKFLMKDFTYSLGASGAIFGVVGGCANQYPNMSISMIFLPFISVPIKFALPTIVSYDIYGLFKKVKIFDHAAHLTGVMVGYSLYSLSTQKLWPNRKKLIKYLNI